MVEFAARAITLWRGDRLVLRDAELSVRAGEALALSGPNGAGKSTLLRVLALLLDAQGGTIEWDGAAVADDPEAHRARLHYLGHRDGVKAALSARENLTFHARARGVRDADAVEAALSALGLATIADFPARILSQGQRRRTALARLVVAPAPLWLLDEPFAGLDGASEAALTRLLDRHLASGGMAVIATHAPLTSARRTLALVPVRGEA